MVDLSLMLAVHQGTMVFLCYVTFFVLIRTKRTLYLHNTSVLLNDFFYGKKLKSIIPLTSRKANTELSLFCSGFKLDCFFLFQTDDNAYFSHSVMIQTKFNGVVYRAQYFSQDTTAQTDGIDCVVYVSCSTILQTAYASYVVYFSHISIM